MNEDWIRSVVLQYEDEGAFPEPFMPRGLGTDEDTLELLGNLEPHVGWLC